MCGFGGRGCEIFTLIIRIKKAAPPAFVYIAAFLDAYQFVASSLQYF
jgi:hypothetical protein